MKKQTAIVCDDHPIFRNGVVQVLSEIAGMDVVAVAADVDSAIGKLQIYTPGLLVLDLSMPGKSGFVLLEWAKANQPGMKVVVLSMHTEIAFVKKAQALGADGFLAKDDAETDLVQAVGSEDGVFFTSSSIGRNHQVPFLTSDAIVLEEALKNVSVAEMKVLIQLSHSKTNKEIAETLHLSPRTVEAHRSALAEKLDARGPNKLLEFAIRHRGLLDGQT